MNFRTCKYFLTVCELGTINAAARKLFISQQSLSQHIRKLEAELGVQLFHRDNPLVLTQAGQCVKKAAQTVLDTMEQMEKEIADRVREAEKMRDKANKDFIEQRNHIESIMFSNMKSK